jgi:ribosomal protein L37AE/L43A
MQCRKCGNGRTTRRRAGVFFCQHCGMQPGPSNMDRCGNPSPAAEYPNLEAAEEYIIRPRARRLIAGAQSG